MNRLMSGDIRSDDLTRLFLYSRDRCDGRQSVQEIGDFVAHHEERTKGIVTQNTRDWYLTARFHIENLSRRLDSHHLPQDFPDFLAASVRRRNISELRRQTGFSRQNAMRAISHIREKFNINRDGTLSLSSKHTQEELGLIQYLSTHLDVKPAFDGEKLFDDFRATLRSHGLLAKQEETAFEKYNVVVSLFAVSVMHKTIIKAHDGYKIRLMASGMESTISVQAAVPVKTRPANGQVMLSSAIFETKLNVHDCCSANLAAAGPWESDLEVADNGLLTPLC